MLLVSVGTAKPEDASATQDAFCGSIAARACVEHLGFRWRESPEVLYLQGQPICRFRDIQDAIESLELHVEVSLGSIIIGSGEKHRIRLMNQSTQMLRIDDVIARCGCVLIEPRQLVLQPNETKFIGVQITAANLGRNTHELTVMSSKRMLDTATLAFDGVNGPRLLPRTSVVGVLSVNKKNQLEHQLTLGNVDADQLVVTGADLLETDAPIQILLSPSTKAESDSQLTIRIVLKEDAAYRGLFFSNIRLNINNESRGRSVPLTPMLAQIGVEIVD